MEKFWLFEEYNGGGKALFHTKQEAENFRRQVDIDLLSDPEIGEAMADDEYSISEVALNPDFETWWHEP